MSPILFRRRSFGAIIINYYFFLVQMNNRVKALKRQLDESEEEVQREKVGKRKAQREYEDLLETHETIARECSNLRNKLR